MELVYGAGKIDRMVADVEGLLRDWLDKQKDWGQLYLEHEPITPTDRLVVEDLAVTMLMNSQVDARAARGASRNAATLDLLSLPDKPLEATTDTERRALAEVIATAANWEGFGASTATKTLHKKRPTLIPVLDNRAIFEAYMHPLRPKRHTYGETVKALQPIKEALDWIASDITRLENESVWPQLQRIAPERSRIELFDMVWWMHFREVEPR